MYWNMPFLYIKLLYKKQFAEKGRKTNICLSDFFLQIALAN